MTLGVFVAFNLKRVIANKTVFALIVPTLVFIGILMFDYENNELLGFTMLAIPALLVTIAVFTTQNIAYKREGKAAQIRLLPVSKLEFLVFAGTETDCPGGPFCDFYCIISVTPPAMGLVFTFPFPMRGTCVDPGVISSKSRILLGWCNPM